MEFASYYLFMSIVKIASAFAFVATLKNPDALMQSNVFPMATVQ